MATITLTNGPDDYVDPTGQSNTIEGLDGDDRIRARDGDDGLDGGAGADRLFGGTGNDRYVVDNPGDLIVELNREGIDLVESSIDYTLAKNVENLTLTGMGDLVGHGNKLGNMLIGNDGDNVLTTGDGQADVLQGGAGDDIYVLRNGNNNTLVEAADHGIDTIRTSRGLALPDNFENIVLTGNSPEGANGNALDNRLVGNAFANRLNGNDGNDVVKGRGGADTLLGAEGGDRLVGGSGADTFQYFRTSESGVNPGSRDVITDFQAGVDQFDFRVLEFTSGQNLHFGGSADFSGDAGELHTVALRNNTFVEADIDGDGSADLQILLRGTHTLSEGDFVL